MQSAYDNKISYTCSIWVKDVPYRFGLKRPWVIDDWKLFLGHNWLCNLLASHESRMCSIDFGVQLIIDNFWVQLIIENCFQVVTNYVIHLWTINTCSPWVKDVPYLFWGQRRFAYLQTKVLIHFSQMRETNRNLSLRRWGLRWMKIWIIKHFLLSNRRCVFMIWGQKVKGYWWLKIVSGP